MRGRFGGAPGGCAGGRSGQVPQRLGLPGERQDRSREREHTVSNTTTGADIPILYSIIHESMTSIKTNVLITQIHFFCKLYFVNVNHLKHCICKCIDFETIC